MSISPKQSKTSQSISQADDPGPRVTIVRTPEHAEGHGEVRRQLNTLIAAADWQTAVARRPLSWLRRFVAWLLRPFYQQQLRFNYLVIDRLAELQARISTMAENQEDLAPFSEAERNDLPADHAKAKAKNLGSGPDSWRQTPQPEPRDEEPWGDLPDETSAAPRGRSWRSWTRTFMSLLSGPF